MHLFSRFLVFVGLLVLAHGAVAADGYGDVSGQFVLVGEVPNEPEMLVRAGACGPVPNERVIVDPETKGLANVFVWITKVDPELIRPDLREPATPTAELTMNGCRFEPRALIIRAGQRLNITNADPFAHNIRGQLLHNPPFNVAVVPNGAAAVPLPKGSHMPQFIQSDIRPWMTGAVFVVEHPYAATSDSKGRFRIEGLPVGVHRLRIWYEKQGYLLRDRPIDVDVRDGETLDLGRLEVSFPKRRS